MKIHIEGPVREKNTYWLLLCIDTDRQTDRQREAFYWLHYSTRVQNCRLLNALRKYEPRWRGLRSGHTHAFGSAVVVSVYLMPKKPRAWSYRCRARTRHVCGRYIPAQQCYCCCCCCCWRGRRWKAHRRIIVTASAALGRRSLRWQLRQDKTRRLHTYRENVQWPPASRRWTPPISNLWSPPLPPYSTPSSMPAKVGVFCKRTHFSCKWDKYRRMTSLKSPDEN